MEKSQWSKFKLRVNVQKEASTAYACWTNAEALESWFLRKAIFKDSAGNVRAANETVQEGDTYEWYWHGYPDSVVEKGTVLKANGSNMFCFTFSKGCPVTISVYSEEGETIVELVESDLPTDETTKLQHFVGDSKGWIFYLTNLKSVLEGGIDLRNKKLNLVNVITA
ncbi:SRPBCC domain-containing protein [Chondrinema litorale]|uniref:SRPBCC domain-containing protein n=1 Tax=Chondrinema litorale TaxID=2994555 RepID=UPI0025431347|nr:SRPBCC domain-containing protein [Chondrinema litorale]UZR99686.1 SRPBCC domain-containing protein [Chondrinema litorale]